MALHWSDVKWGNTYTNKDLWDYGLLLPGEPTSIKLDPT